MQLTERIHLVGSGRHGFDLTHASDCHVYAIDGGDEIALIDAGSGIDVLAIVDRLARAGLDRDRVRRLFVTHAHADHAGGSAGLHRVLDVGVAASPEVAAIIRAGDELAASVDVGRAQGSYPSGYRYEAAPVDAELRDGDRVAVGALTVGVIATPGHAVGHLSFLVHDGHEADLFTGDTLLAGGRIILQNTWDCDLRLHVAALRRLGEHRFRGLFPGHLSFSAVDGERHLRVALDALDRGAIPPLLT